MPIFDEIDRVITDRPERNMPDFEYLNLSARAAAEEVRQLLEQTYANYPVEHQNALRSRLRSQDNKAHRSALFELVLHELMLRSQCTILAVEPDLAHTERSPDFLIQAPDGSQFYLEATLATGL